MFAAPGLFFACALAYWEEAEACFHASVAARPRTLEAVITTWVIIRCACTSQLAAIAIPFPKCRGFIGKEASRLTIFDEAPKKQSSQTKSCVWIIEASIK